MNDTERASLVEELTTLVAQGSNNPYSVMNARAKVTPIIHRLLAPPRGGGVDIERALRKIDSLHGQIIEIKANINALQRETGRLEDDIRNEYAAAQAQKEGLE